MGVRQIDCNGPGIRRVGAGKGFFYKDADGVRVDDPEVLERIAGLAIPPAWSDVWICSDPRGHIQATGTDARGRRQYLYHQEWQQKRDEAKYERVQRFAERLPELRARVEDDLKGDDVTRERALATALKLIETGCLRVGGEAYADENGSYGVATLLKRHVRISGDVAHFDFTAKSGQRRRFQIDDPTVVSVLRRLKARREPPDADLLAYKVDGEWRDVRSEDINDYLRETIGDEFSAKDFRTWAGTVLAALALSEHGPAETDKDVRKAVAAVGEQVAEHLGNTPAVARSAYIDPRILDRFEAGVVVQLDGDGLDEAEAAVAELLASAD